MDEQIKKENRVDLHVSLTHIHNRLISFTFFYFFL
jgi:hypothetical protein